MSIDHWITTEPESSEPAYECVACGHRDSEARMVSLPSLNPLARDGVEWWCAECAWYQEWVCAQALRPDDPGSDCPVAGDANDP